MVECCGLKLFVFLWWIDVGVLELEYLGDLFVVFWMDCGCDVGVEFMVDCFGVVFCDFVFYFGV